MGKLKDIVKACETCREKDPNGQYTLFEGTVQCTACYERHLGAFVAAKTCCNAGDKK